MIIKIDNCRGVDTVRVPQRRCGDGVGMSLGIVIKSPAGIVLAADSRVTLQATNKDTGETFAAHYDNATKILRLQPDSSVAALSFGQAVIPGTVRTPASYVPELERALEKSPEARLSVSRFATELSSFMAAQWDKSAPDDHTGPAMTFYVAGYDPGEAYGRVFKLAVPDQPEPEEQHVDSFGASWGGQMEIVDRIYKGIEKALPDRIVTELELSVEQTGKLRTLLATQQLQIPIAAFALQDCVDLAVTLIRTTIKMQELAVTVRGVGGPIDVVSITRTDGAYAVQIKEVTADVR